MKYALHPGYVKSMNDGDDHYISFEKLRRLYGLNSEECIEWNTDSRGVDERNFIHLYPKYDGNYILKNKRRV